MYVNEPCDPDAMEVGRIKEMEDAELYGQQSLDSTACASIDVDCISLWLPCMNSLFGG